jgi:2-(1,2-epoxy-1,2-dihydrophenyl)acetyl-CoA isomerase
MDEFENFHIEREDHVAWVAIESTAAMNALTDGMIEELLRLGTELDEDDDIRCIVLRGSDGVFCAGGNISSFDASASAAAGLRQGASLLNNAVGQLKRGRTPLITGIDGPAVGAGFSLALLGDITLMHEEAYLQFGYPRVGLSGDGSATYYLPHLVGLQEAKRIALLNERIPATEAEEIGLVTEIASSEAFDERLSELASSVAEGPTKALGRISRMLEESFARQVSDHLTEEVEQIGQSAKTDDYIEGVSAFKDEREPEFEGR